MGVCLIGVYLMARVSQDMSVCLIGMHLTGYASLRRASY
jgi:hypothetical protein